MNSLRSLKGLATGVSVAAIAALAAGAAAQQPYQVGDLAAPRGLSVTGSSILIADQGNGRVLRSDLNGNVEIVVTGVTAGPRVDPAGDTVLAGISAAIEIDGMIYYLTNRPECFCLWSAAPGRSPSRIADLGAYEAANNTDGGMTRERTPELQSNPYALVASGSGGVFITDAAANAVLHVTLAGTVVPYAVFPDGPNPLFPQIGGPTMDVVPTGVALGPDGALYVGSLTGFPFPVGAAEIYRLADGNGDGDALDEGEVTVFASGFSSIVAMAFDWEGALVVAEFSTNQRDGLPGRLVRVDSAGQTIVAAPLVSPTGIAVTPDRRILVSQEFIGIVAEAPLAAAIAAQPRPAR